MGSHYHLLEDTQCWLVDILQREDSLELDMEGTHQLVEGTQAVHRIQQAEVGTLAVEDTQPGGTAGDC